MSKLDQMVSEQAIDAIRELTLIRLIDTKLQKMNVSVGNSNVSEVIAEAILEKIDDEGDKGTLTIPDWADEFLPKGFAIEFTDEDAEFIEKEAKNFIKGHLSDAIVTAVRETAKDTLGSLEDSWRIYRADLVASEAYHSERVSYFWGECLSVFELMLAFLQEKLVAEVEKFERSRAKRNRQKREVKLMLLSRAVETASEVKVLLKAGMSNGAFARWRTLDELTILMQFIEQQDNETSKRYLAHEVVDDYEYSRLLKEVSPKSVTKAYWRELSELRQELVDLYGEVFTKPYGWAAAALGRTKGRVSFSEIAASVEKEAVTPDYKLASWKIHAGVSGFTWSVHNSEHGEIYQGLEISGLHMPLIRTAYSLSQIAGWHAGTATSIEIQIEMTLMVLMRDKIERLSRKAQKILDSMTVNEEEFE